MSDIGHPDRSDWSASPVLGLIPFFHLDPAVGGAPLASPDGHWWWDGEHWQPRDVEGSSAA